MASRFEIRVDPFWRPLILPFGGTDARSYAEITDERSLRVCFGFLFDHSFALDNITRAAPTRRTWWSGIGWRTNFVGTIGLLGSHDGCVEIRFRKAESVTMILPSRCERLTISLKQPQEFLAALAARGIDTSDSTMSA